jgi:hypothetical protein
MARIKIAALPTENGLSVRLHQHGGTDAGQQIWSLERNQWGLMVSSETADCLSQITSRVASQCIYPYALRERLQESIYGRKALKIEVDTDVTPVADVRINGRAVR